MVSLFQVFRYWSAARSERAEKNKEKERERERERGGNPLPHPLAVFPFHISPRCPYDLNALNRRVVCRKKNLAVIIKVCLNFRFRFAPHEREKELNMNGYLVT